MFRNLSTDSLGVSGRQSEIIELALSFGFKGVDLDLVDFQQQVQLNGLARARRLLDSAKLKIGTFRLPLVWDDTDEVYQQGLQSLAESLKLASDVGAVRAVTSLSPANDARPYHENFEFHRRRLTELGELLASHGIRLGIEMAASAALRKNRAYQFIYTLDALAMLVSMIRSANVGIVLDPWQVRAGGGAIDDAQKIGGSRIVAVYLSDAPADVPPTELTDEQRLLPGETGAIDSAAVLTRLADWGFDGPVTPRAHRSRVVGMRREQVVKLAGQRLDDAWKSAGLNSAGRLGLGARG
jgi:sugar phosphate isomerase/epimerase